VTIIISVTILKLITPKAGAKHELLFNEPASDHSLKRNSRFLRLTFLKINLSLFLILYSHDSDPGDTVIFFFVPDAPEKYAGVFVRNKPSLTLPVKGIVDHSKGSP
jgi:hypothetical protein